jgi:putative membrane protein insertion efficiency factor
MSDAASSGRGRRVGPFARLLMLLVTGYRRFLSPLLPPTCRFTPTCSAYALKALQTHGAVRGSWLTVRRIARCHPFHPGGYDPVPPPRSERGTVEPPESFTGERTAPPQEAGSVPPHQVSKES